MVVHLLQQRQCKGNLIMTTKHFTANVISATKVVPAGKFENSKASGVWDLSEQFDLVKGGNWPNIGNPATRALFAGGYGGGATDTVDTLLLASAGNATDFGNLTSGRYYLSSGGAASSTRAVYAGGANNDGDRQNIIEYFTFASTGNGTDFGDIASTTQSMAGCSSSTRGIFAGGET